MKFDSVGPVVDGTPVLIMKDGRWDEQEVQRLALLKQDILAAARDAPAWPVRQY